MAAFFQSEHLCRMPAAGTGSPGIPYSCIVNAADPVGRQYPGAKLPLFSCN